MIKYILIICIIIVLIYLLFRYTREGFDSLNSMISIADISNNLLSDNSYNFIDSSLNVVNSKRYYPSDLFDINDIVDTIVTDDIDYNSKLQALNTSLGNLNQSIGLMQNSLDFLSAAIQFFDDNSRNTINTMLITNTKLNYNWATSSNIQNVTDRYNDHKGKYDALIQLRDSILINPVYSRTDTTYSTSYTTSQNTFNKCKNQLTSIRQIMHDNSYTTINVTDVGTTGDTSVINSILSGNSDLNSYNTYLSTFTSKYNNVFLSPGPGITRIDFSFNSLNLNKIWNLCISPQTSFLNNKLAACYNTFQNGNVKNITNLNNYINSYGQGVSLITGMNDASMNTKITQLKAQVDLNYISNAVITSINLSQFKVLDDSGNPISSTIITDISDVNIDSKIQSSMTNAYNYVYNKSRYQVMATSLYGIMDLSGQFDFLFQNIMNDIKTNVYYNQIKNYVTAVNNDIIASNSIINSVNHVLSLACVPYTPLPLNPLSVQISTTQTDINSYIDNPAIFNISYNSSSVNTNTNITCNNVSLIKTTNSPNITTLKNYMILIKSAMIYYTRYQNYQTITQQNTIYNQVKDRLMQMLNVRNAYQSFFTPDSNGNIYGDYINKYNNLTDMSNYFINTFSRCAIKKYTNDVYKPIVGQYNTLYSNNNNASDLNNVKNFFDYFYDNFQIKSLKNIQDYYTDYVNKNNTYLQNRSDYESKTQDYKNSLANIKQRDSALHSRISDTIQGIMNDTNAYNQQVMNTMIENKNTEMMNNLNSYTQSVNQTRQDAYDYLSITNDLLVKQQNMFNYGSGTDTQFNEYINNMQMPFVANDAVRSGTIDRYMDPSCNSNEFIYCIGGEIDCVDIYGDTIKDGLNDMNDMYGDYKYGKTYGKCGSYISKVNLTSFSGAMSQDMLQQGNTGYYYDLTKCPADKPWRVGGEGTPIEFKDCYDNTGTASMMFSIERKMDPTDFIDGGLVYVDSDYMLNDYAVSNPTVITYLNNTKGKWFGNKRMYQAIIKSMNMNNLFDIYLPDMSGVLLTDIDHKYLKLPNLTPKPTPYMADLPPGSYPRPICRYGKFTDKCSKGSDPPIDFKNTANQATEDELNKYLITPKYEDTKYVLSYNVMDDLNVPGTQIANINNNALGFTVL